MACADEKGRFTLSWDIDNFSAFLFSGEGVLTSPAWKTDITGARALWWSLSIYPSESNIRINLKCLNESGIPYNCEVSIVSSCGEIVQKDATIEYITFEWSVKKDLYTNKMHSKTFQDAVTLECKMWQKEMKIEEFRMHSVVEEVDFFWNMTNKDELIKHRGLKKTITKKDTLLVMDLNLKSTAANNYVFCAMAQPVIEGWFSFVKCLRYTPVQISTESEGWYNHLRTEWRKDLLFKRQLFTIILKFIVAYHKNGQIHIAHPTSSPIGRTQNMPKDVIEIENLCENLLHLYRESILSDVILRNGGKSLAAHRSILAARSPVFRSMFEKDETTEGRSRVVNIQDVDHETMDRMLVFLYSDSLEGCVQWEEASKLYYAADKYDVQSLKHRCRDILIAGLTINNACEALVLADRHEDGGLMASIVDFIGEHPEVIYSKTWGEMEENNPRIAAKVTRELYLRKVMN